MKNISISIEERTSKKTNKPYKVLVIKAGVWEKWVFITDFEYEYLKQYIN